MTSKKRTRWSNLAIKCSLILCLCYKKNSRWHLQTNFPVQFSTQINTLLRSTALLYSTRVFPLLLASLPASPVSCLPHSLYTLPLFSPAWSHHLLPLIIHTSVKLPSLSHLFCSSSRFILFHLLVPTSLLRPHAHHTPEVIVCNKKSLRMTDSRTEYVSYGQQLLCTIRITISESIQM